jgi:hypothetical protein
VITVGAMNAMGTPDRGDDVMTTYSSKGPTPVDHIVKPDLVAPGNQVISLMASSTATLVTANPGNRPLLSYYKTQLRARTIVDEVLHLERNQHGDAGSQRGRRSLASAESVS